MTNPNSAENLQKALAEFVGAFEVVFHYDWDYASQIIGGEEPSFLEPGLSVAGESNDWGARGALLEKYRKLVEAMKANGLSPAFPFPLANLSAEVPAAPSVWTSST